MDIFDNDFQDYITWKVGEAHNSVEDEKKLKEIRDEYDKTHDIIYNSLNEKQKKNFDEFLSVVWKEFNIDQCIAYKIGITDEDNLKKYKALNNKKKKD